MHQLLSLSCQTFHIYSSLYWIHIVKTYTIILIKVASQINLNFNQIYIIFIFITFFYICVKNEVQIIISGYLAKAIISEYV